MIEHVAPYGLIATAAAIPAWRRVAQPLIAQADVVPPGAAKWLDQGVMGLLILLLIFFIFTLWKTNQELVNKVLTRNEKSDALAERLIVATEAMRNASERLAESTEYCRGNRRERE